MNVLDTMYSNAVACHRKARWWEFISIGFSILLCGHVTTIARFNYKFSFSGIQFEFSRPTLVASLMVAVAVSFAARSAYDTFARQLCFMLYKQCGNAKGDIDLPQRLWLYAIEPKSLNSLFSSTEILGAKHERSWFSFIMAISILFSTFAITRCFPFLAVWLAMNQLRTSIMSYQVYWFLRNPLWPVLLGGSLMIGMLYLFAKEQKLDDRLEETASP